MNPTHLTLSLLAGAVLLAALGARLAANRPDGGINTLTRFFLIGLRLVIGWHFLIEGLEKLHSPTWSSEVYLREASGPLAPHFRELAGDRLVDKLTVGADGAFPAELENEWRAYLDAVIEFYQLDAETAKKATGIYDQAKSRTLTWLTSDKPPVQVSSTYPPSYTDEMTIPERLKRLDKLEAEVRKVEADIPQYGKEVHAKFKNAKSDLAKWRADLKRDLDGQYQALKKDLRDGVLTPLLLETAPAAYRAKLAPPKEDPAKKDKEDPEKKMKDWLANVQNVHHQIVLKQGKDTDLSTQAERIFLNVFDRKENELSSSELLPFTPTRPIKTWTLLDWSDAIVKYGLVIVGGCLLAGFLTRTACLAGALFLLMFFLAMPPLPGWPDNPRAEGHYLFINKNTIEMFALLALATLRTGRWAGLDGLLMIFRPSRWRGATPSATV